MGFWEASIYTKMHSSIQKKQAIAFDFELKKCDYKTYTDIKTFIKTCTLFQQNETSLIFEQEYKFRKR